MSFLADNAELERAMAIGLKLVQKQGLELSDQVRQLASKNDLDSVTLLTITQAISIVITQRWWFERNLTEKDISDLLSAVGSMISQRKE